MSEPMRIGVLVSVLLHAVLVVGLAALPFYPAAPSGEDGAVSVRLVMTGPASAAPAADTVSPEPPDAPADVPSRSVPATAQASAVERPRSQPREQAAAVVQQEYAGDADARQQVALAPATQQPSMDAPARQSYLQLLAARIHRHKFYPAACRRFGEQGRVMLGLVIRRDGALEDIRVVSSSGHARLDDAALQAVQAAAPFSPIPASFAADQWSVNVPIDFSLR